MLPASEPTQPSWRSSGSPTVTNALRTYRFPIVSLGLGIFIRQTPVLAGGPFGQGNNEGDYLDWREEAFYFAPQKPRVRMPDLGDPPAPTPEMRAAALLRKDLCGNFVSELMSIAATVSNDRRTPSFAPIASLTMGMEPSYNQYSALNAYAGAVSQGRVSASNRQVRDGNRITYGETTNYSTIQWHTDFYALSGQEQAYHIVHESLHLIPGFSDQVLAGAAHLITSRNRTSAGDTGGYLSATTPNSSQYLNTRINAHCR